jgi:hypothetical protein
MDRIKKARLIAESYRQKKAAMKDENDLDDLGHVGIKIDLSRRDPHFIYYDMENDMPLDTDQTISESDLKHLDLSEISKDKLHAMVNPEVQGKVQIRQLPDANSGPCLKAYMVVLSDVTSGWGPLLYDVALEWASQRSKGLTADRQRVSSYAYNVWKTYLEERSDVESIQMDDLDNTLTPTEKDNCLQQVSKEFPGGALSKVYRKKTPSRMKSLKSKGLLIKG